MDARGKITSAYDLVAEAYAAKFWDEIEKKHFDRIVLRWLASQIATGQTVLEIGAGPGEVSGYLGRLGARCLGTDASPQMIEHARRLFPDGEFQVEDFFHLSFPAESFAAVVAFYAIVNYPLDEVETILREVLRVLASQGLFLFTFHVYEGERETTVSSFLDRDLDPIPFYYFPVDEMKQLVLRLGFRVIDIVERHPYPDVEFASRRAYFILRKP
jgi:ubiquinone/menaquinone biosynthesis C-methylase UbiE